MWTYFNSLLTGLSAKSTFKKVENNKLLRYLLSFVMITSIYLSQVSKPYQPEKNFIEIKYLTVLLIPYPGLLHVTV